MSSFAGRNVRNLCCALIVLAGLVVSPSWAALLTATWTGGGGSASYNDALNWDTPNVPVNDATDTYLVVIPTGKTVTFNVFDAGDPGKTFEVVQLSLAQGSVLSIDPARKLNVLDAAAISGDLATAGGTFTAPSAAAYFGERSATIDVSGAGTVMHAATGAYMAPVVNGAVLSADGAGSALNLPDVQTIDVGWNDNWNGVTTTRIVATNGATMDLSGVTKIIAPSRSEDRLDILINNDGAGVPLIDLSGVETLESVSKGDMWFDVAAGTNLLWGNLATASQTHFELAAGATLTANIATEHDIGSYTLATGAAVNAATMTRLTEVTLTLADGAHFNAPDLVDITGSTVNLSGPLQQFTHDTLTSVDARLLISGGTVFGGASDTEYTTHGVHKSEPHLDGRILSADGAGTQINLPGIQTIDAGWDDGWSGAQHQQIVASNDAAMDLSGVSEIIAPWRAEDRLEIIAETGGQIDLSSLQTAAPVAGAGGEIHFIVRNTGVLTLGGVDKGGNVHIIVANFDSDLVINDSVQLSTGTFTVAAGATVTVGGDFSHEYTEEADFQAAGAILHMNGAGTFANPQRLEVAGEDKGLGDPGNSGNFGFGQLALGTETQATVVSLYEVMNNGNRASSEALYLFGLGGPDGLLLKGGSTLVIGSVPVYAMVNGDWMKLNGLFTGGAMTVNFAALTDNPADNGVIVIPEPGTLSLLALGGVLVLWRRRGR